MSIYPGRGARALRTAPLLLLGALAACDGSSTGSEEPAENSVTVDASASWAYVRLDAARNPVTVASPSRSGDWDIAFNATSVMLNGGSVGMAGVAAFCLCQNSSATDAQVMAMTAAGEALDFETVTAARIPAAADAWVADTLKPAVTGWYAYDTGARTVAPDPSRTWKVRTAEGTGYAKVRVTAIAGATQTAPGTVTLEYALQPAAGAAFGETRTLQVPVPNATAPVYVDLARGAVTDAADWDLAFDGWNLRVNGGASGSGQAGAALATSAFASITTASDLAATAYRGDAAGGLFGVKRWYRYNLTGTDHQVWPTYEVYLLKRGSTVWKVQVTGYYSAAGNPRHISLRWAKLAG